MRYGRCLPALALCLLLTGCGALPYPREMGNMALLRTVGVDKSGSGVRLTVSTGPRARGLQGEREAALTLTAEGATLSGAAAALQGMSDSYVFFGYVDQLLVGEELAREGLERTLDCFARDGELSLGAQLWVVRGTAQAGVSAGGDQGVERRLENLRQDGEMGLALIPRTAGEVYTDILERGAAYVPALRAVPEEGSALAEAGYAVFRGDALAGFLEGEAARGLELLEGRGRSAGQVLEGEAGGVPTALRVTGTKARCRFLEDGRLSLSVEAAVRPAEYAASAEGRDWEALRRQLEARQAGQLRSALDRLRTWGTDCAGLGARAALGAPALWGELREDWPDCFARREPEIRVRVEIQA